MNKCDYCSRQIDPGEIHLKQQYLNGYKFKCQICYFAGIDKPTNYKTAEYKEMIQTYSDDTLQENK